MKDVKIASRYAKSLLKLAIEQKELEKVYEDMKLVSSTCHKSKELSKYPNRSRNYGYPAQR